MKLSIIGTGYVGLVSGVCLAALGHEVVCIDKDKSKIDGLNAGKMPIYEIGLSELVAEMKASKRLQFTDSLNDGVKDADAVFIAVGTPSDDKTGMPDMRAYDAVLAEIKNAPLKPNTVVVIKSTVPIGTVRRTSEALAPKNPVASNPEFLREGNAIHDFMHPDRVVIGVENAHAEKTMRAIYAPQTEKNTPLFATNFESAELIKYASNCLLASKVAFINEVADICEQVGADVEQVAIGVGMDKRIGEKFLKAGPGFGGSCFPKDMLALLEQSKRADIPTPILEAVITSNNHRMLHMVDKIAGAMGDVKGKTIAILGLTFKAGTDDVRSSPSLVILPELLKRGAKLVAYDPKGMEEAKHHLPSGVTYAASAEAAIKGADAAVVITEWDEFKKLPAATFKSALKAPLVIDLRNIYVAKTMTDAGLDYISVGRAA